MSESLEYFQQAHRALQHHKIDDALAYFRQAERTGFCPEQCAAGRWKCYMFAGHLSDAWRESDRIAAGGKIDSDRFWDGSSLHGKRILIRCLHGLGDTIQFVRYARVLQQVARTVTIEAQPRLKGLLAASSLADAVMTWGEPEPLWDAQVEVMELPRIFRTSLETIPCAVPYIIAPPLEFKPPISSASDRLRVGLIWTAGDFNPLRSLSLDQLQSLLEVPGASFFSLQHEPEPTELMSMKGRLTDLAQPPFPLTILASAMKQLDLIISVDTAAAHLAGALAKPVWTLLPFHADWRWMLERRDTPWYPTMRLWRQKRPGDWSDVVEEIACGVQREAQLRAGSSIKNVAP